MTIEELLRMGEAIVASNLREGLLFTIGGAGKETELSVWVKDAKGEWCQDERHILLYARRMTLNDIMGEVCTILSARGCR